MPCDRVGPKGINPSALHSLALKGRQTGTHMTRTPRLLYDVSVWNKLFRRSFWDPHQLSYPEGVVWEDIRLMTKAHVLARAVDVIPDVVYYWRERAQGAAVHHAEPDQHRQPARPDDRADRHRPVHRRALDGQAAPGAPAQGPEERPVALRPGPAQGDRRLPGRVRRPGERLPGSRRPPGAAQPARPPQAGLLPGPDPGHAAARGAGRLDHGAAGAPGAHGPARGRLRADLPFRTNSPVPVPPACSGRTGATWTRTCRWTTSAGRTGGWW